MSATLAAVSARMRHVGTDERRFGHSFFGPRYRFVLSDLTVAVPALDRRTHSYLEHRVAGWSTTVHFRRRSESPLWSGELPAGTQFRQDLAGLGIFDNLADSFGVCYLPAIRPLSLL